MAGGQSVSRRRLLQDRARLADLTDVEDLEDMSVPPAVTVAPPLMERPRTAPVARSEQRERAVEPLVSGRDLVGVHAGTVLPEGSSDLVSRRRFGQWLNRPRRILLTLMLVWVVHVFDLGFTMAQWGTYEFVELNPLAARIVDGPAHVLAGFKFGLLGIGTVILLSLRRQPVAELACWFLLATTLYLAVRWYVYFDCLINGQSNPMIEVPIN